MRTYVDLPGGNGKIKRVNNRINGDEDRDERDGRQSHEDTRRARRESRQLLRRVVAGDDLSDLQPND